MFGGKHMLPLNKKKQKKIDLLQMPDVEKHKLMKEVKENLRHMAVEAKLWQSFLESDSVTINGEKVHCDESELRGLTLKAEILRNW
jgi:hypothetical protein